MFGYGLSKKREDEGRDSVAGREKLRKWHESCWKLTWYTISSGLALLVAWGEPWFTDSRYFWLGCTQLPCDLYVSKGLLLFYCVQIGFYIQVRSPLANRRLLVVSCDLSLWEHCCMHGWSADILSLRRCVQSAGTCAFKYVAISRFLSNTVERQSSFERLRS